jgi:hypothetical protein
LSMNLLKDLLIVLPDYLQYGLVGTLVLVVISKIKLKKVKWSRSYFQEARQ